jgi:hypothetical protein
MVLLLLLSLRLCTLGDFGLSLLLLLFSVSPCLRVIASESAFLCVSVLRAGALSLLLISATACQNCCDGVG